MPLGQDRVRETTGEALSLHTQQSKAVLSN